LGAGGGSGCVTSAEGPGAGLAGAGLVAGGVTLGASLEGAGLVAGLEGAGCSDFFEHPAIIKPKANEAAIIKDVLRVVIPVFL
jgi:hypothetical protein